MKKILIVEDDRKLALAMCVRLKANDYATWMAGDSIEGLRIAIGIKPDLIILDLSLPAGHGLALARQLRQLPETRRTPILFATASKDPALRVQAEDLEVSALIRKPYTAEALLTIIEHALGPGRRQSLALAQPTQSDPPKRIAHKLVLIVEDDQRLALAISLRLKAAGFETINAEDAVSAVRFAAQFNPDVVILDISIPAGDGFVVAERIQSHVHAPIPIVFLTASKRSGLREKARELGAVGFLEKPYDPAGLLALVTNAVSRPRAAADLDPGPTRSRRVLECSPHFSL